jgi:hypothetical protein
MADLARIKRNVAKMVDMGAPETEIDGYIASEGVTVDDVRNFKPGVQGGNSAGAPSVPQVTDPNSFRERVRLAAIEQGINQPAQPVPSPEGNPAASVLPGPLGGAANNFNAYTHGAMDASTLNMGDELYAGLKAPFIAGIDAMQGRGFDIPRAFQQELKVGEDAAANIRGLNPDAYDKGSVLGSLALMGRAPGGAVKTVAPNIVKRAAVQGGTMGAAMGFGHPGSLQERMLNAGAGGATSALLGAGAGKLASYVTGATRVAPAPKRAGAPLKTAELFDKGDAAFKAARASGAVLSQSSAKNVVGGLRQILVDEGAITPSGKVADLPKINHALNLADDYASADMTMEQLLRVRKQLGKAASSTDKDERSLAMALIQKLDKDVLTMTPADFAAGAQGAPKAIRDWEAGRGFWHTAKKAETVEELANSAVRQSRKSAAVPVEQATRNKFANFTDKAKNLRGFSPEEVQALKDVSQGSAVGNTAKQVGRLAPTTLGGLGVKAGIPWAIGNAVGGPVAGTVAAVVTVGAGYVGKIISGLSTANKAKLAQLIIRNGGVLPNRIPQNLTQPLRNAVGNLIIGGAAAGGNTAAQLAQALQVPQASAR